jgi:GT2 family glycosyltransferase
MSTTPLVSIHILNYNGGEDILRCLRSVQQLAFRDFCIVVIDNASTDTSLARIQAEFPEVRIIRNTANLGFGAGHNVGIREALNQDTPFIWLLNQDATVAPDSLNSLVHAVQKDSQIGALSPIILNLDDTVWFESGKIDWWRMRAVHTPKNPFIDPEHLSGCAIFLRTEALRKAGVFDENFFLYYEDADLSLRIRQAGFRLLVEPKSKVWHTEASNRQSELKTLWLVWSGLLFFRKHASFFQRLWLQLFFFARVLFNQLCISFHPTPLRLALRSLYRLSTHQYGWCFFLLHPRQLPERGVHPPLVRFLAEARSRCQ